MERQAFVPLSPVEPRQCSEGICGECELDASVVARVGFSPKRLSFTNPLSASPSPWGFLDNPQATKRTETGRRVRQDASYDDMGDPGGRIGGTACVEHKHAGTRWSELSPTKIVLWGNGDRSVSGPGNKMLVSDTAPLLSARQSGIRFLG